MFHVSQWDSDIMHTDASLTLTRGVEQGALYVQMSVVSAGHLIRVLTLPRIRQVSLLQFIYYDAVNVNRRVYNQVHRLLLDLDVSIRPHLIEPGRGANTEHGLPCDLPCHAVIQLVRELHGKCARIVLRVIVE
jgi:hypothetical protein